MSSRGVFNLLCPSITPMRNPEGREEGQHLNLNIPRDISLGHRFQRLIPFGITIGGFFGSSNRRDEMSNVFHISTVRAFRESMKRRALGRGPAWRVMLLVALNRWNDRREVFPVAFSSPPKSLSLEIEQGTSGGAEQTKSTSSLRSMKQYDGMRQTRLGLCSASPFCSENLLNTTKMGLR